MKQSFRIESTTGLFLMNVEADDAWEAGRIAADLFGCNEFDIRVR
jgi:hypothetical protein